MLFFIRFGIFDVIDILLVAFIMYMLYRLIRGTAAINIFVGIFIFYLLWLLVLALNMELISTILGQFISVGVIALLIVFQQEIRHFLLMLGSRYNLQNFFSSEGFFEKQSIEDEVANSILASCESMMASKTGALIVISQNNSLDNIVDSGVKLSASISSELIENIFFKNTPLHDGAVVITENKIVAARCILPVSERLDIPGSMGLRHRAALGLSATCDALIVVVSEETGFVSVFKDGSYKHNLDCNELNNFLHKDFSNFNE